MAFLPPDQVRALGALSAVGLSFVLAMVIGVAAGVWLDRHAGTSPWRASCSFALGVAAGILNIYRATRQAMADARRRPVHQAPGARRRRSGVRLATAAVLAIRPDQPGPMAAGNRRRRHPGPRQPVRHPRQRRRLLSARSPRRPAPSARRATASPTRPSRPRGRRARECGIAGREAGGPLRVAGSGGVRYDCSFAPAPIGLLLGYGASSLAAAAAFEALAGRPAS